MNTKTLLVCTLLSLANSVVTMVAYHVWFAGTAGPRLAMLDVAEIYRLKESQFSALIMKPNASEADRAQAIELARAFGTDLAAMTRSLPRECGCLVLTKAAVVGSGSDIPDLTPESPGTSSPGSGVTISSMAHLPAWPSHAP